MKVAHSPAEARTRACYVHVPFCRHRCGYCNFTLVAGRDDLIESYLQAIQVELARLESAQTVDSIFVGGGTPTQLAPPQLDKLLHTIRRWFSFPRDFEFSVEANPADVRPEIVSVLADHGVTRVSLGAQSFHPGKLEQLERDHTPAQVHAAFEMLSERIASVALDLIFAVPGETVTVWRTDLDQAVRLAPHHVSTYGLTFEKGTSYWNRRWKGQLVEVDEQSQREMYLAAIEQLPAAGIAQYEISNFARPGHRCRHNETYWKGESFYGFGPGAARFLCGVREMNHRSTTTYIKRLLNGESAVAEREQLSREDSARERLVFALRRLDGVERDWFRDQTGFSIDDLVGSELRKLLAIEVVDDDRRRIRLTRKGMLLSDSVSAQLLG